MSEASFTLFQNTAMGIETIIYACFLTAFFYPHMAGKKGGNAQEIIKVLIIFLSYAAVYLLNIGVDLDKWVCMVIVTALLTAASRYLGHLSMIFDAKWQNFCVRKIPMPMLV